MKDEASVSRSSSFILHPSSFRRESYGSFAWAYDQALGERFFIAARPLLTELFDRYPAGEKTHLDIACGTGLAVEFFRGRGWESAGVDASLEMLAVARKRAGRLVGGDFRALPFRRTFARITCLYDSFNHIKDRSDLVAAFRSVRRLMNGQSLFIFDVNHPDVYPLVWGSREPFAAAGSDYELEIATTFRKRDALGRAVVRGWALSPDGTRVEIREVHEQRAYSEREIVESLGEASIAPVAVIPFDPYNETATLRVRSVKMVFVCRGT